MGLKGACYPWQSGLSGQEETPKIHFNPVSEKWDPDYSFLQLHANIAVFYNVWNYYCFTGNFELSKSFKFLQVIVHLLFTGEVK